MLYWADNGVRRNSPARGRVTPDSAEGRSSPQTLKSLLRLRNGSSSNRAFTRRVASAWNLGISAAVYPSPITSRSTFSEGGPLSNSGQTTPAGWRSTGLTNRDAGSTTVDQRPRKLLSASRRLSTTCTGTRGHGNRSDSWKLRCTSRYSGVVSHSP